MPAISDHTAIIILAAGNSSRLGLPKQLLPYKGKTLLEHIITEALTTGAGPVLVVLGAGADELALHCSKASVIINQQWQEGMSGSIRCGVQSLLKHFPGIEGCILSVCDQPLLNSTIFRQLIDEHLQSKKSIIAAAYDETTLGTPVYFHHSFFPDLLSLSGDKGARSILQKNQSAVGQVPFPGGKLDIDKEGDLGQLEADRLD